MIMVAIHAATARLQGRDRVSLRVPTISWNTEDFAESEAAPKEETHGPSNNQETRDTSILAGPLCGANARRPPPAGCGLAEVVTTSKATMQDCRREPRS